MDKQDKLDFIITTVEELETKDIKLIALVINSISDLKPSQNGDGLRYNLGALTDDGDDVIDCLYHLISVLHQKSANEYLISLRSNFNPNLVED